MPAPVAINLTGQRFGRLLVIKRAPNRHNHTYWLCTCDCGVERIVAGPSLGKGNTRSCGCLHAEGVRFQNLRKWGRHDVRDDYDGDIL